MNNSEITELAVQINNVVDNRTKELHKEIEHLKDLLAELGKHDSQCYRRMANDKQKGLNPVCDCGLWEALKE